MNERGTRAPQSPVSIFCFFQQRNSQLEARRVNRQILSADHTLNGQKQIMELERRASDVERVRTHGE